MPFFRASSRNLKNMISNSNLVQLLMTRIFTDIRDMYFIFKVSKFGFLWH